jgi:gluconokinase
MISSHKKISAIIVMGVSGSGKSTVAEALAARLGFTCGDGDSYHPQANIDKMQAKIPLTDEDRWPWLQAIAADIDQKADAGRPIVIACSALKRTYRDILVDGRDDVRIAFLKGSKDLIAQRLANRRNHFMPPSLLDSQFNALEEPGSDEPAITVSIDASVENIVDAIVQGLGISKPAST